jgi:hypothetical protein
MQKGAYHPEVTEVPEGSPRGSKTSYSDISKSPKADVLRQNAEAKRKYFTK